MVKMSDNIVFYSDKCYCLLNYVLTQSTCSDKSALN